MKERTVWELARMAECSDPDTDKSPGASFLRHVERETATALRRLDDGEDWTGEPSRIANATVPEYAHALWTTFVDLAAYSEDVSDLGMESVPTDELEKLPSLALYMIGERLALALFQAANEDGGTE